MKNNVLSVVVPVKNREDVIGRAIKSILSQKCNFEIEIIVVDDASTDYTISRVKNLQKINENISLIQNTHSVGGAVARNIGAKQAQGKYIAFLDSDDEWLENHLEKKIKRIISNNSQGAFGAFNIIHNNKMKKLSFPQFLNANMVEYIFEKGGDARTSTFVFQREAFMKIMFDYDLEKHQDWDLAIRFSEKFRMTFDSEKNVNMYVDGKNRMSNKNNYLASNYFLSKHSKAMSNQALYNFKLNICFNAYRNEGNSSDFESLLKELTELGERNNVTHKLRYRLVKNPILKELLPIMFYIKSKI